MRLKSNAKSGELAASGTIFEYYDKGKRLFIIHRIFHFEGWFLTAYDIQIADKKLKSTDLFDAMHESVEIMRDALKKLNKQFDEAFSDEVIEIRNY